MNEKYQRTQYLICTAAGFTCLVLWLLACQTVGTLAAHGWIRERTTDPSFLLYVAVVMLFLGSRAYSKMLFARLSPDSTQQPTQPVPAGRVVTLTVLLTLAVALVFELQSLSMEGGFDLADIVPTGSEPATLLGLPIAVGAGTVGLISIGPLSVGVISVGGFGIIAIQGVGFVSLGGVGLGVIALGGAACGVIAIGGACLGYIAIGGGAVGVYVLAGGGTGRYVLTKRRQDPEAVALFGKWFPRLRTNFRA